jgi:tripartite-type tricarboxylate transporter receptor subunit TctC
MKKLPLVLIALSALCPSVSAHAADYPNRVIRMIVPYPAGGTSDVLARVLAKKMGDNMGQSLIIENIGGAAGTIGATAVARATPDGYTLIFGYATQFTIAPALYQNLSYDPIKSFVPIGSVVRFHFLMTAYSALPVNSLSELVAHAKTNPGKLTYASPGVGTSTHLIGVHVPYRGGGPAITDYVAGRIDIYWDAIAPLLPWVQKGNIKPLAVTSAKRMPDLPNVPTAIEAGMPDLNVFTWTALFAPAGVPSDVAAKLEAELQKAMADKDVQDVFFKNGYEMFPGKPASVAELIRNDLDKWSAVVQATGLKVQ